MILFFLTFFLSYSILNYYIVRRGWQGLVLFNKKVRISFVVLYLFVSFSYVIARGVLAKTTSMLYDIVLYIGAMWFAFLVYIFLLIIIIDILRVVLRKFNLFDFIFKESYKTSKFATFLFVIFSSVLIVMSGFHNANDIVLKEVKIELPFEKAPYSELNLLFFSDLHLSPLNDERLLDRVLSLTEKAKPDIILMGGDIVDDSRENLIRDKIDQRFKRLRAPRGVYSVVGNHEYIVGVDGAVKFLEENGVRVIIDSNIVIDEFLNIVFRDDVSRERFVNGKRKELSELMQLIDTTKLVIVVDHQPFNLQKNSAYKIDLHLSGHTHHGQLFPGNFITKLVYEVSWGLKKINQTHFYVSSGVGTWGPPVRIGSQSEMILFKLVFYKPE